jgi:hypothetical protein
VTVKKPAKVPGPAKPPAIELGATPAVQKRLGKGLPAGVQAAWDELKAQLRRDPRFVAPDKRNIWERAFGDVPNHRHADLPSAWRTSWTIRNADGGQREIVTVLFLGTHKEYDQLYGFATS